MTILSAHNLGRRVDRGWLWRGLSLQLDAGECLGVAGPSGVGKTLLLRALARLDPLDEGALTLAGRPAAEWPAPEYRARVLFVHQRPELLEGTVDENLRAVLGLRARRGQGFSDGRAADWLTRLGRSPSLLRQRVEGLSGGERQSAALARALLCGPDILLLDEPTSSLDGALARRAEQAVTAWLAEGPGRAALWVSHDPGQVARVAGRRLDMESRDA